MDMNDINMCGTFKSITGELFLVMQISKTEDYGGKEYVLAQKYNDVADFWVMPLEDFAKLMVKRMVGERNA